MHSKRGLTWIRRVGLDPCDILRGRIEARFDAAMAFLDCRLRHQLMRRRGVEVRAGLGFQDRMIAFQRQQKIGLVRDDLGGDLDLTAHGVDGDERAFELSALGQMIEQFGNGGDLVGFFGHAQLCQRQIGRLSRKR